MNPIASGPTVTESDAEHGLARLLDRVEAGEELVITRRGEPVAKLVPVVKQSSLGVEDALAIFRRVRESLAASGSKFSWEEVRSWRDEGRR